MNFSVVIPLFNKAPHVKAAITSALEQSHAPREIIVVDDGSTDGSLEIVQSIDHPSVRILSRSPPGPGGYAARNLGIENATSEWIAFLDADDLWHSSHLSSLSHAIQSCGGAVGCAFTAFDIVGQKRRRHPHSARYLPPGKPLSPETILKAWLDARACPIWTGAVAFRKDILIGAGLFPRDNVRRGGDKDLWLRAILLTDSVYSASTTAEFQQDTVNRVSLSTSHLELPVLSRTIAGLINSAPPGRTRLLKRLSNLEVVKYARYSAGARSKVNPGFFGAIYLPTGVPSLLKLLAYTAVGTLLSFAGRKRRGTQ